MSSLSGAGSGDAATREVERKLAAHEADAPAAPAILPGAWATILLCLAAIVTGWWSTFLHMWDRWYPAWGPHPEWPLKKRLTEGDSYYSHGPLVLLASLAVAFVIYKRVGLPIRRTRGATMIGLGVFAFSLFAHLVSVYARVGFLSGFAMIGVLCALMLMWGGWPMFRAYWLPAVFLAFLVPLPAVMISNLNFQLKLIAGEAALWLTNNLFNVRAVMSGSVVFIQSPVPGEPDIQLVVENVCSGLRSLIALVWFASLFAMVCRAKGPWRVFMLAMAVPVALACNIIRITMLNVVAYYYGVEASLEGSVAHDMGVLLVFVLALAMLFGLDQAIVLLGRLFKRDWSDDRLMGFLEPLRKVRWTAPLRAAPVATVALVLAAAVSVIWAAEQPQINRSDVARSAVPLEIEVEGVKLTGTDDELDELSLAILETRDYLYRHFEDERQRSLIDLLIVFSVDNRKGTHPPEVCLEGTGGRVVEKRLHTIEVEGVGPVELRELIVEERGRSAMFTYVYKSGNYYTPNFLRQQATIFWNGMTNRNAAGALIRFSAPIERDQPPAEVRERILAAAKELMVHIDANLP